MKQYIDLLKDILENGTSKENRTGIDSVSVFGKCLKFDAKDGFPLITTRKCSFRVAFEETMFFLRGETQTKLLESSGIGIWKENTSRAFLDSRGLTDLEEGDMGKGYGYQIRNFGSSGYDQLSELLIGLKNDPNGRRHVISHWCPHQLTESALPPCHVMHMYSVANGFLHSSFVMRSSDAYLGLPMNIASYAFLNALFAKFSGLIPGELTYFGHDVHLYVNHVESAKTLMKREPKPLPSLTINKDLNSVQDLLTLSFDQVCLENYDPHPALPRVSMAI